MLGAVVPDGLVPVCVLPGVCPVVFGVCEFWLVPGVIVPVGDDGWVAVCGWPVPVVCATTQTAESSRTAIEKAALRIITSEELAAFSPLVREEMKPECFLVRGCCLRAKAAREHGAGKLRLAHLPFEARIRGR